MDLTIFRETGTKCTLNLTVFEEIGPEFNDLWRNRRVRHSESVVGEKGENDLDLTIVGETDVENELGLTTVGGSEAKNTLDLMVVEEIEMEDTLDLTIV